MRKQRHITKGQKNCHITIQILAEIPQGNKADEIMLSLNLPVHLPQ